MKVGRSDTSFGPHVGTWDVLKMGHHNLKLNPDDSISVGGHNFQGSPGLFDLIFSPEPTNFNEKDLHYYKNILKLTSKHLRPDGKLKSSRNWKYMNIIKHLFKPVDKENQPPQAEKQGGSLMNLNDKKIEYVYFNDCNELVDRLMLLVGESCSGNDAHSNEILSIIEELVEQQVIYKPKDDILNSL